MLCRKIIHIDMDAFYASVEQRDNPEYRGKPIAVGGAGNRGVVAAASYEARKFGIHSAMPGKQAIKKCPEIIFVKPRFDVYKKISRQIIKIFKEYSDLVEPLSLDEAYLDVTNPKKGKNSATLIAKEIRNRIYEELNLTASAGVSYNKFLAKIASDIKKPNGLFVIHPEEAADFINKLPIEKFHGVGKVTAGKFKSLDIHYGFDLKQMQIDFILKHFGKNGLFFYDIARGIDNRKVEPERVRKSVGAERTFSNDLSNENELYNALEDICNILFERLLKSGLWGKTLTIKIKYYDFSQITRSKSFSEPLQNKKDILKISSELMHKNRIKDKPLRLLGVSFSQLESASHSIGKQLKLELNAQK
ncbi:MAG: DNA polymerase IV [Bacteroidetes bacterium]|nr:MAG: DNA polymerase IV [Bacteroidota bacterium]